MIHSFLQLPKLTCISQVNENTDYSWQCGFSFIVVFKYVCNIPTNSAPLCNLEYKLSEKKTQFIWFIFYSALTRTVKHLLKHYYLIKRYYSLLINKHCMKTFNFQCKCYQHCRSQRIISFVPTFLNEFFYIIVL